MKAFLSHSSKDKVLVTKIFENLGRDATWIDRAEIEWGDLFLEKIAKGVEEASDFVLFWSSSSKESQWVRLELHMAFIQMLSEKAIRLRVVVLDETHLPLYLKPFHFLDASGFENPANTITARLKSVLEEPQSAERARFLNRNQEIGRIEQAIDDPQTYFISLFGFQGIGKKSLSQESLKRLFEGVEFISIDVSSGTDLTELALRLNASIRNTIIEEKLPVDKLREEIALSIETLAKTGRFLCFWNTQHWLNEDAEPVSPFTDVLEIIKKIPAYLTKPIISTSTRRISISAEQADGIFPVHIGGLKPDHIATLIRLRYNVVEGKELHPERALELAKHLHGHPVAAKLAAGLIGQGGVDFLLEYPRELIHLRRDLARQLLSDISFSEETTKLLECLSVLQVPLPASVIQKATQLSEEEFLDSVKQASEVGVLTPGSTLQVHPLLLDYYWRSHWSREDYKPIAKALADAIWEHTQSHEIGTAEFGELLPVVVRLYGLAGQFEKAIGIRSDLLGELFDAAISHYHRRNYDLAETYLQYVIDCDPSHWKARLFKARILIRREKWKPADNILEELLKERPHDTGARHAFGWRYLRSREYEKALEIFTKIIASKSHVQSLRDGAECLHALDRDDEALQFLERAKAVESENAFVLDLEARILEDKGELDRALSAARLAALRQPHDWSFHHRVGRILAKQSKKILALEHFRKSIDVDPEQFTPRSSMLDVLLDQNVDVQVLEKNLEDIKRVAKTPKERAIFNNLNARLMRAKGDINTAAELMESEISNNNNVIPNLSLLAHLRYEQYNRDCDLFPASAKVFLEQARAAMNRVLVVEPENPFLQNLQAKLTAHD